MNSSFLLFLSLFFSFSSFVRSEVLTLTTPSVIFGNALGQEVSPWFADGVTDLQLAFETGVLPVGASLLSVSVRVQGEAIAPSYLSEVQLVVGLPSTDAFLYDFEETLGYPEAPGPFDTTELEIPDIVGQAAEGTYLVVVGDDLNDEGLDFQIDEVDFVITYAVVPTVVPVRIGDYVGIAFPVPSAATSTPDGLETATTAFAPETSNDMQSWSGGLQALASPPAVELPPLAAGTRYVTYGRLQTGKDDVRAYFRVNVTLK